MDNFPSPESLFALANGSQKGPDFSKVPGIPSPSSLLTMAKTTSPVISSKAIPAPSDLLSSAKASVGDNPAPLDSYESLFSESNSLNKMMKDLDIEYSTIDKSDPYAVSSFNTQVSDFNKRAGVFKESADKYNSTIPAAAPSTSYNALQGDGSTISAPGYKAPTLGPKSETISQKFAPEDPWYTKAAKAVGNAVQFTFEDAGKRLADLTYSLGGLTGKQNPSGTMEEIAPDKAMQDRVIKGISAGLGLVNTAFLPVTAAMKGAEYVPVVAPIAKGINTVFTDVGEVVKPNADLVVDSLPISDNSKQAIRPVVTELMTLLAQVATGNIAHEVAAPKVAELTNNIKSFVKDLPIALTKDKVITTIPAKRVYISPDVVRDYIGGRKITDQEATDLYKELGKTNGRTGAQIRKDFAEGVTVDVPEKTIEVLKDKPYWSKVKEMLVADYYRNTPNTQAGFIKNPFADAADEVKKDLGINTENPSTSDIPKDLEPLAQEARKYKTAEEFVKARTKEPESYSPARQGVDTVYHQTSPESARTIVFSNVIKDGLNLASSPDLALGQKGKGALIEMASSGFNARKINKPGSNFVAGQDGKWPEFEAISGPSSLTKDVKSVTFDQPLSSKGELQFFGLRQNWKDTKEVLPDGKVKYTNPTYMDKKGLADFYNKAVGTSTKLPQPSTPAYKGPQDLSIKTLDNLKGRSSVSKQFISDLTNSPDMKDAEREIVRNTLEDYPDGKDVPVKEFADKVESELLPLEEYFAKNPKAGTTYEHISLPDDVRGNVADYKERIYESPIQTSAGETHFSKSGVPGYFAHSRIEDLANGGLIPSNEPYNPPEGHARAKGKGGNIYKNGDVRRVIELQSDLFQKGRLESEKINSENPYSDNEKVFDQAKEKYGINPANYKTAEAFSNALNDARNKELLKLEPYRNTWHERIIREEIKQAAKDGKIKLQFPTGETAMKIEGLGVVNQWYVPNETGRTTHRSATPSDLKVGNQIDQGNTPWIITDVLGDGKFKAVPKRISDGNYADKDNDDYDHQATVEANKETFDISGKLDTSNPIYKFYESTVAKYLKRFGAKKITDTQGVTWNEIDVPKEAAKSPVQAFKRKPLLSDLDTGPKITLDQARDLIYKDIPKDKVRIIFRDDLIEDYAVGMYTEPIQTMKNVLKPMIELYEENGLTSARTAYHESAHYIFNNFFTEEERLAALDKARGEISTLDRIKYKIDGYPKEQVLEEFIADEYARQKLANDGYKGPLESFFMKLDRILKRISEFAKKVFDRLKKFTGSDIKTGREGGYIKNPFAEEKVPPEEAFKNSTDQEVLAIKDGRTYEIGSYGKNALERKSAKIDRLPKSELTRTIKYITSEYVAGDSSFRKDNTVHVAEMPDGEKRAIITRENAKGNLEVINFFKIGKDFDTFKENLEKFGTPGGIRTRDSLVRSETADSSGQGIDAAKNSIDKKVPEVKQATVEKPINKILPNFDNDIANDELTEELSKEDTEIAKQAKAAKKVKENLQEVKANVDGNKIQLTMMGEALVSNPARQLSKYVNKRTGELPEVTGKPTSVFAQKGDDIATELGFKDSDDARAAYAKYAEARKRYLEAKGNISEVTSDFREKKQIIDAVAKQLRAEGRSRKQKIDAIQEFFKLTDDEMKSVIKGNPDYRLITDAKFEDMLKGIEGRAYDAFLKAEAMARLQYTIFDRELLKVDNLRKANKLPEIENMSRNQLDEFNKKLEGFKVGDEFLGVRQLQTISNTDLAGVATKREALEDLAKRAGVPFEDMQNIKVKELDRILYDVALARRNPFYNIMVQDMSKALATANVRLHDLKSNLNELLKEARKSRSRSFLDKLVPTDDMIFDFLEADDATKIDLAKRMTAEEIKAAQYVKERYAEARDYLIQKGQLDRHIKNYITHTEQSFLEALKNAINPRYVNRERESVAGAVHKGIQWKILEPLKNLFDQFKQQEANFTIMNQKTGDVLPLEKFFKFAMSRTGELTPTRNVARAVTAYMSAFEKKVALDSVVPKIDIYAHSLSPNGLTKRGLALDDSLKRFVKEWLNTKRGRVLNELIKPGGKADWAIRSLIAVTRVLDLGLNVPVGLASNIGEQLTTFTNIGIKKTALGAIRSLTPKGRTIAEKYTGLVGEKAWDILTDVSKDIGDKFGHSIFGLFSTAARQANVEHLLGSMTPEEYAEGEISPERLGALRLEIGKYRNVEQASSIVGATAIGKAFTQYKSWAVPMLHTTASNIKDLIDMVRDPEYRPFTQSADGTYESKGPFESVVKSRQFHELLRATFATALVGITATGYYLSLKNKKNKSFIETIVYKAMNDSLSMLGALDPGIWLAVPRTIGFLSDLGKYTSMMLTALLNGQRAKDGGIPGVSELENTVTPTIVRHLFPSPDENQQLKAAVLKTYNDLMVQAETDPGKAFETLKALKDQYPDVYDKVNQMVRDDTKGLTTEDKLIRTMGITSGERARYIYTKAMELPEGKRPAYIDGLIQKGIVNDDVSKQVSELLTTGDLTKKPRFPNATTTSAFDILHTAATYADAIGSDPLTALNRIFTGQRISRVDNGAIIVDRMSTDESEKEIAAQMAATTTPNLTRDMVRGDHTIPLELGGSNYANNLRLVTTEEWAHYTHMENYLADKLKSKAIDKKEAQDLIVKYKQGAVDDAYIYNLLED